MKKFKLFAASLGLMTLAACSNTDDVFNGAEELAQAQAEDNAIQFGTYFGQSAQTRAGTAGAITTASLKTGNHKNDGFGVFAYYTGANDWQTGTSYAETPTGVTGQTALKPNFMYNQQVKWTDKGESGHIGSEGNYAWAYTPLKYWPNDIQNGAVDDQTTDGAATGDGSNGGKLSFFAYAPYVADASGDYGITNMTANSVASDPILTYAVAAKGNEVVDLLWGTTGTNGVNVLGNANSGVTHNSSGTNYQKSILPNKNTSPDGYTLNADLTKQKTDGQVNFAFKHALAKVGGSNVTTSPASVNGLMIKLDLDDDKGAETGGTKEDATKVTVKSINIVARAKSAASGDEKYYQTKQTGTFNLATGRWSITSSQGTDASAATTTYLINQDGTSDDAAGQLAAAILEPTVAPAKTSAGFDGLPAGVTTTAQNVYATEAAPLVYIPGTYPELTVTVDYIVRSKDSNLADAYSEVEQIITKKLTFGEAVKLNKQYNLLIHLGLTGIKFTATVSDWDTDIDEDGIIGVDDEGDRKDINIPINVQ